MQLQHDSFIFFQKIHFIHLFYSINLYLNIAHNVISLNQLYENIKIYQMHFVGEWDTTYSRYSRAGLPLHSDTVPFSCLHLPVNLHSDYSPYDQSCYDYVTNVGKMKTFQIVPSSFIQSWYEMSRRISITKKKQETILCIRDNDFQHNVYIFIVTNC